MRLGFRLVFGWGCDWVGSRVGFKSGVQVTTLDYRGPDGKHRSGRVTTVVARPVSLTSTNVTP